MSMKVVFGSAASLVVFARLHPGIVELTVSWDFLLVMIMRAE